MFLHLFFFVALLQFGKAQNQCVNAINALKGDLQEEVRDVVRDGNQLLNSKQNVIIIKVQELLSDKTINEEFRQKVNDALLAVNESVVAGNQHVLYTMPSVIRAEVESVVRAELQTLVQTEIPSIIRAEVESLTRNIVAEIQNSTVQLLKSFNKTEQKCTNEPITELPTTEHITESPTTAQTTEQSMSTTTEPQKLCGGPGWRQVVFINMTDTSYNCPPGLNLTSYSKRTCGRAHTNGRDCSSTAFSVGGSEYSRVCGRIRGYQRGFTSGFFGYGISKLSFEQAYVSGISLSQGPIGGRNHIWTFAAGYFEGTQPHREKCPCDISTISSPPFIGNDYFCESGANIPPSHTHEGRFYPDDPLWDGQGCSSSSTCCQLNNPPWFTKNLPNPTTDDIELRLCLLDAVHNENVAIELIELYVQ